MKFILNWYCHQYIQIETVLSNLYSYITSVRGSFGHNKPAVLSHHSK